jgi:hypothetical protein
LETEIHSRILHLATANNLGYLLDMYVVCRSIIRILWDGGAFVSVRLKGTGMSVSNDFRPVSSTRLVTFLTRRWSRHPHLSSHYLLRDIHKCSRKQQRIALLKYLVGYLRLDASMVREIQ